MRPISQGRVLCTHCIPTGSPSTTLRDPLWALGTQRGTGRAPAGRAESGGRQMWIWEQRSPEPGGNDLQGCGQGFPEEVMSGEA